MHVFLLLFLVPFILYAMYAPQKGGYYNGFTGHWVGFVRPKASKRIFEHTRWSARWAYWLIAPVVFLYALGFIVLSGR